MQSVGVTEDDAEDRVRWEQVLQRGGPWREKPKEEDYTVLHLLEIKG